MQEAFPGIWGVFVLTYCPELRPKLTDQGLLKASRAAAAALIEQFLLDVNGLGKGWRIGIVSVDHPQGDPCKECKKARRLWCADCFDRVTTWKPHHNFLIPLVAFGPGGARHRLKGLDPSRPSMMPVQLLRELWQFQQEMLLGRALGRKADVYYGFRIGERAKGHALKYFPRTFPLWPAQGQRLVYYAGFGAAVINSLAEVAKVKAKFEENDDPGLVCATCKQPIVHIHVEAPIPCNWRAVSGADPPS